MLLDKLTNRLQGEVCLRAECAYPERVLNLCGARKLAFWDVEWLSATEFRCRMSRRDYHALRQCTEKLGCTLHAEKRQGIPFFLGRLRRRQALFLGAAICALALFFSSFFIWDFTIEGNTTVPDEEILRVLQENGIRLGTFGLEIDGEDLRNHVLLELPELSWIAVNVSGCQAQVQVRERVPAPERADRVTPMNVVARRDGLVLRVSTLLGEPCVLPGTTVTAGQLLISGIQDTEPYAPRIVAGTGNVTARTWYTLTAQMPLKAEKKAFTGKEKKTLSFIFGTHRVKIGGKINTSVGNYDKITKRTRLRILGLTLPVTAEEEVYRLYTPVEFPVDTAAAQSAAERFLTADLHALVDENGTVSSTLCSSRRSGENLLVTLQAECVEEIGVHMPLLTDGKN
ncbi:MAG: sporulation protein YqfD [Oscillibacter sp.]|jgi:similar to stage IV sporulation protein|nr:sporulation protein YqfD [Oscillibacter sp.]